MVGNMLRSKWDSYKYRFVPWIKRRMNEEQWTRMESGDIFKEDKDYIDCLQEMLWEFKDVQKWQRSTERMRKMMGFNLEVNEESSVCQGRGLRLKEGVNREREMPEHTGMIEMGKWAMEWNKKIPAARDNIWGKKKCKWGS